MFYHLFGYLRENFEVPGAGMFTYISFRASCAFIISLLIGLIFGKKLIAFLKKQQIGETIRNLGLAGEMSKQGTPTMGGILILLCILLPSILFCDLTNSYVLLLLFTTIWLGLLGFLDDYIKVFRKNKQGLQGKFKVIGQAFLGVIVALVYVFSDDILLKINGEDIKATLTTIPFVKNHEFDYTSLISWFAEPSTWLILATLIFVFTFIIIATSNCANLTDGIDGLAAGVSAPIIVVLGILAYLGGHVYYADYLNIMFIPFSSEMVVFAAAFAGAIIAFLWYNTHPAQIFMGDTGSLAIGGIIAVFAILIRKELLLPLLCAIFVAEGFSVVLQTFYFKYTRKKYGEGRRIFLMSPLHHHYQKQGIPEQKIAARFTILAILFAVAAIVTLKIR